MTAASTEVFTLCAATKQVAELRLQIQLKVRVWGMDSGGRPFATQAETIEISGLGARLKGVRGVKEGDIIGIQYTEQKARFTVIWSGRPGSLQDGEIGVRTVEGNKCI